MNIKTLEEQISTIDDQLSAMKGLLIDLDIQVHTEEIPDDFFQLRNQLSSLRQSLSNLDHQLSILGHPEIKEYLSKIDQILPEKGQPIQIRSSLTNIKKALARNDHPPNIKHRLSTIRKTHHSLQIEKHLKGIEEILAQSKKASKTKKIHSDLNVHRIQVRSHIHKLEKLVDFSKELVSQNYRFYITFRTRPLFAKPVLESMIAEWSRRLNRKFLGRNYYKQKFKDMRLQGFVFFEERPDVHAHALIRPICPTTYDLEEPRLIESFEKFWSDQNGELADRDLKNCINSGGDIMVERNMSSMDVFRRFKYSLKQSDEFLSSKSLAELMSPADLDYKSISDLDRHYLKTKRDKEKARFYITKRQRPSPVIIKIPEYKKLREPGPFP